MLKVPLFYFSPKVAFLDDNKLFLQTLRECFVQEYEVFTADKIDRFLKKVEDSDIRIDLLKLIGQEDDYLSEGAVVSIDFMDLKAKVLNLFEEKQPVSVAFIDFDMPEEDGLEVCKKIKNLSLKKALLTGELAETGAVNAFNNGLIEGYVHKNSYAIMGQIKSTIQKLHNDYLIALSNIYAPFITKNSHIMDLYNTTSFEKLFKKLLQENNIAKRCVYEMSGSQILKDKNSSTYLLNVYSQEEIVELILPHLECIEGNGALKRGLSTFTSILDFKNSSNTKIPPLDSWESLVTDEFIVINGFKSTYFITFKKAELNDN